MEGITAAHGHCTAEGSMHTNLPEHQKQELQLLEAKLVIKMNQPIERQPAYTTHRALRQLCGASLAEAELPGGSLERAAASAAP